MTAVDSPLGYPTLDIMVDVDDVIVPWYETVDGHLVEAWGPRVHSTRPWSMWKDWPGRTREEWEQIVVHATLNGLYTHTEPFPYAVEALRRLHWYGHRIHIVTARGFMANGDNIRRWTHGYFETFAIPHDTLTFAKDKPGAQVELGLQFDYAIDDGVHNFEVLHGAGVPTYLHTAPHNLSFDVPQGRRVASLWEFANIVLEASTPLAQRKDKP
jgi:5'(3')-deoxyribonucleotidase